MTERKRDPDDEYVGDADPNLVSRVLGASDGYRKFVEIAYPAGYQSWPGQTFIRRRGHKQGVTAGPPLVIPMPPLQVRVPYDAARKPTGRVELATAIGRRVLADLEAAGLWPPPPD